MRTLPPTGAVPVASGCPLAVDRAALISLKGTLPAKRATLRIREAFHEILLARRCLDRRAIAAPRGKAFVRLARVDHRIGEPDPAADQDHEADHEKDVGRGAVALILGLGVAHGLVLARRLSFSMRGRPAVLEPLFLPTRSSWERRHRAPQPKRAAMLSTVLLIVLILLLVGAFPSWRYSRGWGYGPSGLLGVILVVVL